MRLGGNAARVAGTNAGPPKTVEDSSKLMPCFVRFRFALFVSHSNAPHAARAEVIRVTIFDGSLSEFQPERYGLTRIQISNVVLAKNFGV